MEQGRVPYVARHGGKKTGRQIAAGSVAAGLGAAALGARAQGEALHGIRRRRQSARAELLRAAFGVLAKVGVSSRTDPFLFMVYISAGWTLAAIACGTVRRGRTALTGA